jgi:predicted dehydrogenase
MTALRIGIVGAGANTRERHIPGLCALPGVAIVAITNRTRASAGKVARDFAVARVADHWRELVADPAIDAICIGTWPYLHAEVTLAALQAGKHVLTEARMAMNATEAEAMQAALHTARTRQPGIVGQIVPSPFTLPYDRTVKKLLATGVLGELNVVTIRHTHGGLIDPVKPITWRQRAELSGVNTLTLGIYYEVLLRWLDRDVTVSSAEAATLTKSRPDETGHLVPVTVPDRVSITGYYPGGARFQAEFNGIETDNPRSEIVLEGTTARLRLDLAGAALWFQPTGRMETRVAIAPDQREEWQVEADFVASVREGAPVRLTDFATGVRYMRFTEAAWRAWQPRG